MVGGRCRCDGDEWEMADAPADAEVSHHDIEFLCDGFHLGISIPPGGGSTYIARKPHAIPRCPWYGASHDDNEYYHQCR